MTTKLAEKGVNVNTLVGLLSILGGLITVVFFVAPLRDLPNQQREMSRDVHAMKSVQAVQTEALRTLAEVAKESNQLRMDFGRQTAESNSRLTTTERSIEAMQRRLERLEGR